MLFDGTTINSPNPSRINCKPPFIGRRKCKISIPHLLSSDSQMTINWNDNLIYVPGSHAYGCEINAASPTPSVVRNLTVYSYRFTAGHNEIELGFNWDPPAVVNGMRVEKYQFCIGPYALEPHEEGPQSSSLIMTDYRVTTLVPSTISIMVCSNTYPHINTCTNRAIGHPPFGKHLTLQAAVHSVSTSK